MGYTKKAHACNYPGRIGWYWFREPVIGDQWRCRKCKKVWEAYGDGPFEWLKWREV